MLTVGTAAVAAFTVTTIPDSVMDDGETIVFTLAAGTGYMLGAETTASLSIDNEPDTDGDGTPDSVDTDDDNDGIADFMSDGTTPLDPDRLIPDCGGTPTSTAAMQDGTSANPYCIDTLAELQSIGGTFANSYTTGQSPAVTVTAPLTRHYRLTANIDAWPTNNAGTRPSSITYADGSTATPGAHLAAYGTAGLRPHWGDIQRHL